MGCRAADEMVEAREIEKIKALIARSASPAEEEARSSAYLACKKIRELGLTVAEPGATFLSSAGADAEMRTLRVQAQQQQTLIDKLRRDLKNQEHLAESFRSSCANLEAKLKASQNAAGERTSVLDGLPVAKRAAAPAPRKQASTAPKTAPKPSPSKGGKAGAKGAPKGFQRMEGFYDTRVIFAKYESVCRACGSSIDEGEKVVWTPGEGVQCMNCGGRD
jgi:hypothetical protein